MWGTCPPLVPPFLLFPIPLGVRLVPVSIVAPVVRVFGTPLSRGIPLVLPVIRVGFDFLPLPFAFSCLLALRLPAILLIWTLRPEINTLAAMFTSSVPSSHGFPLTVTIRKESQSAGNGTKSIRSGIFRNNGFNEKIKKGGGEDVVVQFRLADPVQF